MLRFIANRLIVVPFILFGMSLLVFFLMRLIPGDAAAVLLGPYAMPEAVAELRRGLGLDLPAVQQYGIWLKHVIVGDFGRSISFSMPVLDVLVPRALNSLLLTLAAFLIASVFGIGLGVLAAVKQNSRIDKISVTGSLLLANAPPFWLGFLLAIYFALHLKLLPSSGMTVIGRPSGPLVILSHLILPAVTAALIPLAVILRLTRAAMIDILKQQYVTAARARGFSEWRVITGYALRNAMPGIVNICGLQLGYLFGTALFSEVVFNWPGIGQLMYNSIISRDVPVIQAVVLCVGALFVLVNFISDITQAALDPRVRA
ncbi:glutathione ABC transporter permease [Kaistia sp. 32K]|uniref:ABC transporter permease n=1 Tax=Kaistia sp. 32K TaxID=2795690 RepID=UPI0019162C2E|nr:ABC transporter permease [Kaistia sp. 32K]BCP53994.1 glutathione ABC transporter permease [Kaistia sp. 32K]